MFVGNVVRKRGEKIKLRVKYDAVVLCCLSLTICFLSVAYAGEKDFDYGQTKRNPFIPLVTSDGRLLKLDKDEKESPLLIEGIIYDKSGLSYAVVNGSSVRVGDTIGKYQVIKIEENKVIFVTDGEPLEVKLKEKEEEK